MFGTKIDGHLFKRLGHKAQHLYEMGPVPGSHPIVVLGYFKVGGPQKRRKEGEKKRREEGEERRREIQILTQHRRPFCAYYCRPNVGNIGQ
jgi:hypothetical protein